MEFDIKALKIYRIDTNTSNDALLQRIKAILMEGGSHNALKFGADMWNWQYLQLPTADSRIYVCEYDKSITGYYHVPVYKGMVNHTLENFAMVQDVAVNNSMRGKGVFRLLAEYATNDLIKSGIKIFYTFPNEKSIHTFLKYNNYKLVSTYSTYIVPVKWDLLLKSKFNIPFLTNAVAKLIAFSYNLLAMKPASDITIETADDFSKEVCELFETFSSRFNIHLLRNLEYFTWRYVNKPRTGHKLFLLRRNGKLQSAAVVKTDTIMGVETAVIMDFAFTDQRSFAELVHHLRKNKDSNPENQTAMIFIAFNCSALNQLKKFGFIKIPERFNPRNLKMLVRGTENNEILFKPESWLATLSDWDVL